MHFEIDTVASDNKKRIGVINIMNFVKCVINGDSV